MAQKTLLDSSQMKFKWPVNEKELAKITKQQLEWLLTGLEMYPFKEINAEGLIAG